MKIFGSVIALLLAVGCGSDLETLKKEACACKDSNCFESALRKAREIDKAFESKKPTEAEQKLLHEIGECLTVGLMKDMDKEMDKAFKEDK